MKNQITKWMMGICLCLFLSMSVQAQTYNPTEVAALKKVFATKSADGINTNGQKIGVADTTNWNPADNPAQGLVGKLMLVYYA